MDETLTALDATFLELEEHSEGALMHIGGVMVFDPPPDGFVPTVEDVRALVCNRLAGLPRYWSRLSSERTGRWSWPHWTHDERFDVRSHVSRAALPNPGGDAELFDWIADFYSHRLDRTRPLWELVLLEGLQGGRWALAQKAHHCLVDGVSSFGVAELLLDAEAGTPGDVRMPAPTPTRDGTRSSLWPPVPSPPAPVAQAARAGAHAMTAALHATVHPRETLARSRVLAGLVLEDEIFGAPECSLNVAIGPTRRYAAVRCALADLETIRHRLGGSVNDVVLAACTSGLRRLLRERDEPLPTGGLRAMVPVNLRRAADALTLGNRVGSLFVELPVAEPLAVERHRRIVDCTRRLKTSGAGEASGTLVDLAALSPPVIHAALARLLYGARLFNLTITNVRGATAPRYAFGAALLEVHPIVPLAAEHAVGIAIFSHDGYVTFGISADSESMSDLGELAHGVREGIDELLAAAGHGKRLASAASVAANAPQI